MMCFMKGLVSMQVSPLHNFWLLLISLLSHSIWQGSLLVMIASVRDKALVQKASGYQWFNYHIAAVFNK